RTVVLLPDDEAVDVPLDVIPAAASPDERGDLVPRLRELSRDDGADEPGGAGQRDAHHSPSPSGPTRSHSDGRAAPAGVRTLSRHLFMRGWYAHRSRFRLYRRIAASTSST